jgi:hypothetical protein
MGNGIALWIITLQVIAPCLSGAQGSGPRAFISNWATQVGGPVGRTAFLPNQTVQVVDLPSRTAKANDSTTVLVATLETIFHDPDVCCGKNSSLEDIVGTAGPLSLKDLSAKLQGRHILSDGRPIIVTTEYLTPSSITPGQILAPLMKNQALLMEWNSHLYVLYGAVFDESRYYTGRDFVIRKLLLLDARFSDARRNAVFNRETEDWKNVQGLLMLAAIPGQ